MSEMLSRAGALFLAPAAASPRPAAAPPRPPGVIGVLASPGDLLAVAGAVAADLRHAHRSRTALVLLLPADIGAARPSFRASRALARRLAGRDVDAQPAGATVRVGLDGEARAWRAISASAAPAVIGLSARSDPYDALLAQTDELLVAADPAIADLALASLAALGPPAALITPPAGVAARHLAALGLARLRRPPHERSGAS